MPEFSALYSMARFPYTAFMPVVSLAALFFAGACATAQVRIVSPMEEPQSYFRMIKHTVRLAEAMDVLDKDKYESIVIEGEAPNAYALEDYTIAVDRVLINAFTDEELMCLLAHEIAHISLGHHAKKIAVSGSKSLAFEKLDKASDGAGILSLMLKPLSVKAYSREQEIEADIEAVRAIRLFGISPEVYVTVLQKLQKFADRGGYGKGGGFLDSHPSLDTRIKKIRESLVQ